jgi:polyphenol oxidase
VLPDLDTIRFPQLAHVPHAISTRNGGVSPVPFASLNMSVSTGDDPCNVRANRERFFQNLGVEKGQVTAAHLTHGKAVTCFRSGDNVEVPEYFDSDAAISNRRGLRIFMTFADCVPIAFADTRGRHIGAAHAGWRGTALGIGPAVVRAMTEQFGVTPQDLHVGIGPSIMACCYEVRDGVLDVFAREGRTAVATKHGALWRLDLQETNRRMLIEAGVSEDAIDVSRLCTACHVGRFFSHRAEAGRTGRFALCIGAA